MKFGKTSDMKGFFFVISVTGFHRPNARKAVGGDSDDNDTSI
jgi:hypothetical protein